MFEIGAQFTKSFIHVPKKNLVSSMIAIGVKVTLSFGLTNSDGYDSATLLKVACTIDVMEKV